MADKKDIVARAHANYRAASRHTSEWRQEARTNYDMASGHQWTEEERDQLEDQGKPPVVFNRIARTLNAIVGTQINNRQQASYLPRELGDVVKNEIFTSAAEWVREECYAEDEESDSFEDMCISGMGWTDTRMDYTQDPEGKIIIDRVDPLQMYWDVSATKRNLTDAKWLLHIKPMPIDEFESRFPDAEVSNTGDAWEGSNDDRGVREHVYPQDAYNHQQSQAGRTDRVIRVGRYQFCDYETVYRVGPQAEEISAADFKRVKARLDQAGIPYIKFEKSAWKQVFIAGGQQLSDVEPCPYEDGPTFRAMTYKRDRNRNTWYGIVSAMRDPQKFGNKFFAQILDILNKNSKGGVIAETSAVDDPKDIEDKWARPDAVIWVRDGAVSGQKIIPKPVGEFPAGLDRLMAFSMEAVHEVTGVNLEMLGMANREQSGILEQHRKRAGVTILAPLFDALRRYRKEHGRMLLYFIDKYISDGRLIRVVGAENEQYVPLIKQPGTREYDVIVDEAPTSPDMKERVFAILQQMLPALGKMGIPLPPEVLDYMPIPSSLITKWKELLAQSKGNPEMVQQQMQMMQQQLQKLTQENAQLKDKSAQAAAEMQLDQQKAAAEAEAEKARLAMEWQKLQQEMQIEREKLALEREKADMELQITAEKTRHEMERGAMEANLKMDISQRQADHSMRMAEAKGESAEKEGGIKELLETIKQMDAAIKTAKPRSSGKRKMKVNRDPKTGDMIGAVLEDDLGSGVFKRTNVKVERDKSTGDMIGAVVEDEE